MWNFKIYIRNSTINILPIHGKIQFLYIVENVRSLAFKSSSNIYFFLGWVIHCMNISHFAQSDIIDSPLVKIRPQYFSYVSKADISASISVHAIYIYNTINCSYTYRIEYCRRSGRMIMHFTLIPFHQYKPS